MKKLLIALIAAFYTLQVMADDFSLYITASSTSSEYSLSSLKKITFSGGNIVLTTTSGQSQSFAISSITKMYFGTTSSSIQQLADGAATTWDGETLTFAGNSGKVRIYRPSGTLVASQSIADEASISLSTLPRGIYIVNINGKSFKISKK